MAKNDILILGDIMNHFIYTLDNKRYHTLNYHYKKIFNSKVSKICLDANFTCPNIDGTVGIGGCVYCKQSHNQDSLLKQFKTQKAIVDHKWPNSKYIGFFQSNTNTYAPLPILKDKYELILKQPNIIGLTIATRPDAIADDVLDYLEELNSQTYLTIELGLQTIHQKTAKLINRCHTLDCFTEMVNKLRDRKINVVVHIINGLPFETKKMMLETVKYLSKLDIQGLKIHMLHINKDTPLETLYNKDNFNLLTKEEYINIVCEQLELLPAKIVIHRLTGDPIKEDLIAPKWVLNKVDILNGIDKELANRNTYQDFNRSILNNVKQILENNLKSKDIVIDATVGNGLDTLFLCHLVNNGHVYGFDIQTEAIERTVKLLRNNNIKNYTLYQQSHDKMLELLPHLKKRVSAILFNLGYLPNGNKMITTSYKTTIKAIECSMEMLKDKGIGLIVVYPGHKEGKKEDIHLNKYLLAINKIYKVNYYSNTDNKDAPYLITIEKQ